MINLKKTFRVLPIHLINPRIDRQIAVNLGEELESLILTLGGTIVDRVIQKMVRPDPASYIGSGKIVQVSQIIKDKRVDIVVLSSMAKPRQKYVLQKDWITVNPKIEIWDRVDLILHIFDIHARTVEAKLQIELARMSYMGPRIYGMGFILSQQGGGIGTSGIGETNTELMKRHWRNEIKKKTEELKKIEKNKEIQIVKRKQDGFKTVSIVGYTNAGKSSLFNVLTGKPAFIENVLFATLDSSVGKLYISELQKDVLVTDTIGFIRNLPPHLIKAFKSTLLESIYADLLLHVVDVSDPEWEVKILIVNEILEELGRNLSDVIYIFNKTDLVTVDREKITQKFLQNTPIFISTKNGEGIEEVKKTITQRFNRETR
ncbi:MAG: GTPase HflX, partial [Patescibacteria group bacterium]